MKTVYLVRHGLTVSNKGDTVQGADDPLSEEGIAQAKRLADRVSRLSFDTIIASDYARTRDTAAFISEMTGTGVEHSELLREVPYPTSLLGLHKSEPNVQAYFAAQKEHGHDPNWQYEDEENLDHIAARAVRALDFLASHSAKAMVVVSHGNFMRAIVGAILMEGKFDFAMWRKIYGAFRTINTGITVLDHDGVRWRILTWNDHAHLAE